MKTANTKTALTENKGVAYTQNVNATAVAHIQNSRKNAPSVSTLVNGILNGDITALSRAITLIESNNETDFENAKYLINNCLNNSNKSIRIGITGVPGVGKSTFIESFGSMLTKIGKKVAVLAVDPSSSISLGSILGDKTRMEDLVKDKNAFIRPSPSGLNLGGVAQKTREAIVLCEAAGFDIIIIETVGVGQSETVVHDMVDFFLLLGLTGAGDELQGIKRGIIEMADAVIINKADGDNLTKATQTQIEMSSVLHFFAAKKSGWTPKAMTCSAISGHGISAIWEQILEYVAQTKKNQYFFENRQKQNYFWMMETINRQLKAHFFANQEIQKQLKINTQKLEANAISPFEAASDLLENYFKTL